MHSPKMAQHILPAYVYLRFWNPFGVRSTELAILVAAREIDSQFQWTSHEPTALKVGLERDVIDGVKYRRSLTGLGEQDALIIRFGRELFRDRKVSSETFAHALQVFGRQGVTDLSALMPNRVNLGQPSRIVYTPAGHVQAPLATAGPITTAGDARQLQL